MGGGASKQKKGIPENEDLAGVRSSQEGPVSTESPAKQWLPEIERKKALE